jgi:hypothetical protein
MAKLSELNSVDDFRYGNLFVGESGNGWSRLRIGPNGNHVHLLDRMSEKWSTPEYYLLYVSLVSHTGKNPGRYQSPILSKDDLDVFLYTYKDILEGYGGQHLWIGHPLNNDLLIYDHHNIIFAYGNIAGYREVLAAEDFKEGEFSIPCPHSHSFNPLLTQYEEKLFAHFDWVFSELQDGDDY